MKVLITGTSSGIGRAAALKFLSMGHTVLGIDVKESSIDDKNYTHFIADVSDKSALPEIEDVEVLVNNAGVQTMTERDIFVNLFGTMYCTEKYGLQPKIKAIVNMASASAHNGAEFPEYSVSKGGVMTYTKNTALQVAKYGATCNSLSPGGVMTDINRHIIDDERLWAAVMDESLLYKWAQPEEIAEWIYFVAVVNKSMTAQDILIDNGEQAKANFIW
ncbi:MAG: SDR family oxidoreductase [Firmicutes bacterium]|nr:SDR family oxidoreductase [Bacillota bacterium]